MLRYSILVLSIVLATFKITKAENGVRVLQQIKATPAVVRLSDGRISQQVKVNRLWHGNECTISLVNTTNQPLRVNEVVLFSANKLFGGETPMYGEGFQLLSQTAGTLNAPKDIGYFTDRDHYKLAEPAGYRVVYNLLQLTPSGENPLLLGFTSSNRYIGKFYLSADTIKIVMDVEDQEIMPGKTLELEKFFMESHADRNLLYDHFAVAINRHHPRLQLPLATGWCSWVCYGPEVTAQNVYDNLAMIRKEVPRLKYIQIDDGYQTHMGDWLSVGNSFGGGVKDVLQTISKEGFEPAIWVAPFICDTNSVIYKEHKDWLLKDENNQPLRSDKVGFGGWRLAPWYVLDGTHPAVQAHLEKLFHTMRHDWGCTYFKLDANYWGTIPHARYYKKDATRTEAYRDGMKAILKGAGNDAYILGCNQPMWPSLGLVHASRTSMDIAVDWSLMQGTGRENLYRSWQNGKLWWNDPDCIILSGNLTENQYLFHAALLYATGGMLLSGDKIAAIPGNRLEILKKVSTPTGIPAKFTDDQFNIGWIPGKEKKLVVLNWEKKTHSYRIPLRTPCTLVNFFTGETVGKFEKEIVLNEFPGECGEVFTVIE